MEIEASIRDMKVSFKVTLSVKMMMLMIVMIMKTMVMISWYWCSRRPC